jgi:hypothetical protein
VIDAVLLFGALNVAFEFILLGMIPPRRRLRLLGNETACTVMHISFLALNLLIHWGTLIGTMSGVFAFISSMLTVAVARRYYGFITHDRYYTVGMRKFSLEELE